MAQDNKGPLVDRERLLTEFGMLTEESVAALLGIAVITLRNRPVTHAPKFSKVGRDRLYHRDAVKEFLDATTIQDSGRTPLYQPRPYAKRKTKAKPLRKPKTRHAGERAAV